jgi:membrane-bound lytic murein transglycosylase F
MTASVPLRPSPGSRGGGILAESPRAKASFIRCAITLAALLSAVSGPGCGKVAPPALDGIHARGELRVATLNLPTCYYLGAERTEGLEFELASAYAARLGVRLNMYPLENERALQAELAAGRADIAAASLTNTPAWSHAADPATVYARIPQLVVYQRNGVRPRETLQLESARLAVRADSAQERILQHLRSTVAPELNWEQTAPSVADPVEDVDSGEAQYAIVDAREFSFARHLYPDVEVGFALPEERPVQWMVRREAPGLLASVDAFFRDLQSSGRLAQLMQQSSGDIRPFAYEESREFQEHVAERLPQYRAWFEKAGAETGLDWRLLAALGYQESKWDPRAQSDDGARGVMMLTADTAQSLGLKDRTDPEQSIYAGARYLSQVRDKVPERIPEPDRTWLTIAAYNVGFGHLEDARIITQSLGKDPDSWADVRLRLPLLAQERWYTHARHGYARGWEPVQFVDRIQRFLRLLEWQPAESAQTAASAPAAPRTAVPPTSTPNTAPPAPGSYAAGS